MWKKSEKICYVIDVCVGLDVNIDKNISMKLDNYLPLTSELKRLYNEYSFKVIPIVLGATGLVTSHVKKMLKELGVEGIDIIVGKCQKSALLVTLKIVKSFLKM